MDAFRISVLRPVSLILCVCIASSVCDSSYSITRQGDCDVTRGLLCRRVKRLIVFFNPRSWLRLLGKPCKGSTLCTLRAPKVDTLILEIAPHCIRFGCVSLTSCALCIEGGCFDDPRTCTPRHLIWMHIGLDAPLSDLDNQFLL